MAAMVSVALGLLVAAGVPGDEVAPARVGDLPRLDFRLTVPEARSPRLPRIAAGTVPLDLMPGDRPTSELTADTTERPREPGAPVKARMSMRLDNGPDALRPAFALGGLGGALMRVTDALLDN